MKIEVYKLQKHVHFIFKYINNFWTDVLMCVVNKWRSWSYLLCVCERGQHHHTKDIFTRTNAKRSQPWYFHAIEREAFGPKNISNLYSFISYIYFISFCQQVVKYLKKAMPSTQWLWIKPTPTTRSYYSIHKIYLQGHAFICNYKNLEHLAVMFAKCVYFVFF